MFVLLRKRCENLGLSLDIARNQSLKFFEDTLGSLENEHYKKMYLEVCCRQLGLPEETEEEHLRSYIGVVV
jgi:hypothetical protein